MIKWKGRTYNEIVSTIKHNKNDNLSEKIDTLKANITKEQNKVTEFKKVLKDLKEQLQSSGNWCDSCDRPLIENE